ncbi:MAG: metallophosphoesterase [Candidatus Kryptoniota bacterium]
MKNTIFILVVTAILSVYGIANYYIYIRGAEAFQITGTIRTIYTGVFIFLAISFIASVFLERADIVVIGRPLSWIGGFWLGAFVYFLLILGAIDFVRLINRFLQIFPGLIILPSTRYFHNTAVIAVIFVIILVVYGFVNSHIIRVRTIDISIPKKGGKYTTLNIVAASDIHLSSIIGRNRIESIVNKINSLSPDVVLLPGDILDGDLNPVLHLNSGEALRKIHAPLGVYAVTGNHEYIGGVEKACKYISEHGIKILRDSGVFVDESFYIVGREDFSSRNRRPLTEIIKGFDRKYPIILMDHQPFHLKEAIENGIDIQISGHTHYGQLWPFNYITRMVYELAYGYRKIGTTHFYVSSGAGTWGPPMRIFADPEIVQLRIRFM